MKTRTYYGIVLLFALVFLTALLAQREYFTSPGTLTQLSASHVPTEEDEDALKQYARQVRHDLLDMTGSA
jgi:hypothetical protein